MRRTLTIGVFFILLLDACKTPDYYFSHPYEKMTTLPGPEDMVLDTLFGEKRIIIACAQRRKKEIFQSGVMFYDISMDKMLEVPVVGLPDSILFNPHGIDLGIYQKRKILWVINHEDDKNRQSVLRFMVGQRELVYDTIYTDETIVSPNDICDGGNGSFYISNDASSRNSGLQLLLKIKSGSVVYYNGSGSYQVFNKKFSYANGIIRYKDRLIVSTSRQNKVFTIKCNEDGSMIEDSLTLIVKGKSWDNFSRYGDLLICTSHSKPIKFLKHRSKSEVNSPFMVYSINPETKVKGLVYLSDGEAISAGSTAIYYEGVLYISQVFDAYILKVKLNGD